MSNLVGKFETNQVTNIPPYRKMWNAHLIKSSQPSCILCVQNIFSMNFHKSTGCGKTLNFIQIDREIFKKIDAAVFFFFFFFLMKVDLEWSLSLTDMIKRTISGLYHQSSLKEITHIKYLPWISNRWDKMSMRFFTSTSQQYTKSHPNRLKTL